MLIGETNFNLNANFLAIYFYGQRAERIIRNHGRIQTLGNQESITQETVSGGPHALLFKSKLSSPQL